ncbi:MAG: restriction endonuclease subunit S [Deltaproteobacteria bacterium]|nr:restriction endonuclease subunit S [Deltaproteobacteria bacterium]
MAAGWSQQQLKRPFSINLGKMLQNAPTSVEDVEVPYLKAQHVQWNGVRLSDLPTMWASPAEILGLEVRDGDLLVCEGGEVGRAALVSEQPPARTIIQNALHLVRGRANAEPRFLAYVLHHAAAQGWFDVLCNRSTIAHFTVEKFGEMWTWLPEASHQRTIANYLDRETARLDALVAAKERVLGLLAEKRRALITHAVTRGIDPTAPLRDSGIPWLGEIPAHWRTERLKFHLSEIEQGWSPQCESYPAEEGEWGVLKVGAVNGWEFNPNENKRLPDDIEPLPEYEISSGDVLISRANTTELLGSTVMVREVRPKLLLCDKLYRLVFNSPRLERDFLVLFLRSVAGRYEFERNATGASNSMQNIGQDSVRDVWIPLPPLPEQHAIVAHIQKETAKLDALRAATERTIGLLKERRAALIAAAVTGKLTLEGAV